MVNCAILECKNSSKTKNVANAGISYINFPKDPQAKEKWIEATGKVNWMPTKSSKVCSDHFLEADFLMKTKGYRYLKSTAVPSLKIVKVYNEPHNNAVPIATSPERRADSDSSNIGGQPEKKIGKNDLGIVQLAPDVQLPPGNDENSDSDSDCPATEKLKLERQLRFYKQKSAKQHLKIKSLQSKNRRLEKMNNDLHEILTKLEGKLSNYWQANNEGVSSHT